MIRALVVAGLLLLLSHPAWARPRLVVIVVDGLAAHAVTDDAMPYLARAWRETSWCPGARAQVPMPARTNVSFATLVTGVQPEAHGVTGNAVWDRMGPPRPLGAASDLETETLFTVAARSGGDLRTAIVVGKSKLRLMFAATDGRQAAPTVTWDPDRAASGERDPASGYAYDRSTLAGARGALERGDLDVIILDLADVDRVSHLAGPDSRAANDARRESDHVIGEFLEGLRSEPAWSHTIVIVTADHGFAPVEQPLIRFDELARTAGIDGLVTAADGPVGHVYVRDPQAPDGVASLAAARALALRTDGIAEALYRRSNVSDGGDAYVLDRIHPDWHLSHPRVGDLVLVTRPGFMLTDGTPSDLLLRGTHGGPGEREVPLIVLQGDADHGTPRCGGARLVDVGRTIFACQGLREAARLDRTPISPQDRGEPLTGICAGAGQA